jgi:hypothetical protein
MGTKKRYWPLSIRLEPSGRAAPNVRNVRPLGDSHRRGRPRSFLSGGAGLGRKIFTYAATCFPQGRRTGRPSACARAQAGRVTQFRGGSASISMHDVNEMRCAAPAKEARRVGRSR